MVKRIGIAFLGCLLMVQMTGCFVLFAGAAGGVGTSAWLSGKLSREVNASFDRTVKASRSGLTSLKLSITKETIEKDKAQIISTYTDGKTIWIDIRRVTEASSKVDVRVGAVNGDKEASDKILKAIEKKL